MPRSADQFSSDLERWRIKCDRKGPGPLEYKNDHGIWVGVAPSEVPSAVWEQLAPPRAPAEVDWDEAREHAKSARRLAKAAERLTSQNAHNQASAVAAVSQAHGTAAIATALVTPAVEIQELQLDRLGGPS